MSDLDDFYVHTVTLTPITGEGAYGTTYGAPADVPCFVDETTRLVRDQDGAEVTASATIYAAPGTTAAPGTVVRLPSGRDATVITTEHHDSGPLDLPDHTSILVA